MIMDNVQMKRTRILYNKALKMNYPQLNAGGFILPTNVG